LSVILLWILAVALIVGGLVGVVLPLLPGVPLIYAGMFLAAWIDHFQRVGVVSLVVLGILTLIAVAIDFLSSAWGAKRVGASKRAVWGAAIGTIVGIFFGIAGLILGPFVGALIGELSVHGRFEQASRVGIATTVGLILGTALKLAIAGAMIGLFVLVYWLAPHG
jgi:uncharacterized protein YqgC (DUF456 family)